MSYIGDFVREAQRMPDASPVPLRKVQEAPPKTKPVVIFPEREKAPVKEPVLV